MKSIGISVKYSNTYFVDERRALMSQSNIFVLQGIAIECRKIVKDKAVAKQIYIMFLL